jgi:hypothetical protein
VGAVGATLESVLDVCGVTGTVETTPHAAGGRFLVRWTPKG